ncbi:MAG: heme exporter protein CcmD [Sideroxydans sp. RIFOXYB12_FULL_59_6]|nr:MAG: heme exporter protein CcmD [Sideroxydans sp. RIFOXYB12_FULL_59_6]
MTISEFFYMNGYAFYVWGSYGVTLLVFLVEIAMVRNRRKQALRQLRLMNDDGDAA